MIWPDRARIRVIAESDDGPFLPNHCRQCGDAPCADVCPVEAITLNVDTDAWIVDAETCIGCGACVDACPYDVMYFDEIRDVSYKCDLCGGAPECAAACPTGAVVVG
jgi:Fe-S-cluster-containing hydrogenase component 2